MWVRRNAQGRIEAASEAAQATYVEQVPDTDPEFVAFRTNAAWPPPTDPPAQSSVNGLAERRARALQRKGDRLGAIVIRTGG